MYEDRDCCQTMCHVTRHKHIRKGVTDTNEHARQTRGHIHMNARVKLIRIREKYTGNMCRLPSSEVHG